MSRNGRRFHPPRRQRGVATLLIVLAVGLAVSVTVAATVYSLRGAQSRQLTTHSATAAQAAAWRGVEALRLYLLQVDKAVWPGWVGSDTKAVSGLGALGVRAATITAVDDHGGGQYRVSARVTGEAGLGSALTTATLDVVYQVAPGSGGPGTPPVCASMPAAPMVFNGDLEYTGGNMDVVNATDYENIVVAGDLRVTGNSGARISGCVKGSANVSGGSLTANGHLWSENNITIGGSIPAGISLWGRNVDMGNVSGTSVSLVQAGGYAVRVHDGSGAALGTSVVGGRLLSATGPVPWTRGVLLPDRGNGLIVITTAEGNPPAVPATRFLLDLNHAGLDIDPQTGAVSGVAAVAERLSGPEDARLPDVLAFQAVSVDGGQIRQGAFDLSVDKLWGYHIPLLARGRYAQVWAAGNLETPGATIAELVGGGGVKLTGWESFGIGQGRIAGGFSTTTAPQPATLQDNVAGTSPGLPGVKWCDARVKPLKASDFLAMANYVFQRDAEGRAYLTIRNVKRADGTAIDGVYPLADPTPAQRTLLQQLMTCSYGNDKGCLNVGQSAGQWRLDGVTQMPPGVLWFDAGLQVSGNATELVNTLISAGSVSLPNSGASLALTAPNHAGAARTCGGAFYPSNLCASPSALVTWEDPANPDAFGNPRVHTGLPVANTGVIAEKNLAAAGWLIKGSVLLGETLSTSGAMVTIHGNLTVGSNATANTVISAGGVTVDVGSANGSLELIPLCSGGSESTPTAPASASVLWSRYI
ncbi:hypothetical protein [Stenotrophomonas mori]|uniref:DUF342 domain-containing protein n=1 Tax=Stenotrophomonas mori TaxID=2871096 RepID=A0ABT0SGQ5_9GAMM|nr:hypothetical protein [Stenotrophomonas mori]MCL7714509.1 hypothetical protein [Stenotrophomonas mori]